MTVNSNSIPPKKRGKRSKWNDALFRRIIARIEKGALTYDAIKREGIHPSTFYDHLTDDNSDTLKKAQLCGPIHKAEAELYRRGVKGTLKPVFQQARQVGMIREYDTTALIVYLKGNHPEKYRDNAQVSVSNAVHVNNADLVDALKTANETNERLLAQFEARRNRGLIPS